jgi:hypothetical protein
MLTTESRLRCRYERLNYAFSYPPLSQEFFFNDAIALRIAIRIDIFDSEINLFCVKISRTLHCHKDLFSDAIAPRIAIRIDT